MDDPNSPIYSDNENEYNENSEENENSGDIMDEKWKLLYIDEINYWYKNILNIYTYQTGICPKCHKHTLGINEAKKKYFKSNFCKMF